jgi:hypothetical protein
LEPPTPKRAKITELPLDADLDEEGDYYDSDSDMIYEYEDTAVVKRLWIEESVEHIRQKLPFVGRWTTAPEKMVIISGVSFLPAEGLQFEFQVDGVPMSHDQVWTLIMKRESRKHPRYTLFELLTFFGSVHDRISWHPVQNLIPGRIRHGQAPSQPLHFTPMIPFDVSEEHLAFIRAADPGGTKILPSPAGRDRNITRLRATVTALRNSLPTILFDEKNDRWYIFYNVEISEDPPELIPMISFGQEEIRSFAPSSIFDAPNVCAYGGSNRFEPKWHGLTRIFHSGVLRGDRSLSNYGMHLAPNIPGPVMEKFMRFPSPGTRAATVFATNKGLENSLAWPTPAVTRKRSREAHESQDPDLTTTPRQQSHQLSWPQRSRDSRESLYDSGDPEIPMLDPCGKFPDQKDDDDVLEPSLLHLTNFQTRLSKMLPALILPFTNIIDHFKLNLTTGHTHGALVAIEIDREKMRLKPKIAVWSGHKKKRTYDTFSDAQRALGSPHLLLYCRHSGDERVLRWKNLTSMIGTDETFGKKYVKPNFTIGEPPAIAAQVITERLSATSSVEFRGLPTHDESTPLHPKRIISNFSKHSGNRITPTPNRRGPREEAAGNAENQIGDNMDLVASMEDTQHSSIRSEATETPTASIVETPAPRKRIVRKKKERSDGYKERRRSQIQREDEPLTRSAKRRTENRMRSLDEPVILVSSGEEQDDDYGENDDMEEDENSNRIKSPEPVASELPDAAEASQGDLELVSEPKPWLDCACTSESLPEVPSSFEINPWPPNSSWTRRYRCQRSMEPL